MGELSKVGGLNRGGHIMNGQAETSVVKMHRTSTVLVATCAILLAAVVIARPEDIPPGDQIQARVKRLTSFARPPAESPPATPKQGNGRVCTKKDDCGPVPGTFCLADTRDGKKRCLCSDYSPPVNGKCANPTRALYEKCDTAKECPEGAECRINGNTTTTAAKSTKICQCLPSRRPDSGICSGSDSTYSAYPVIVTFSALSVLLQISSL